MVHHMTYWTYHAIQDGVGIGDWGECGRTMPSRMGWALGTGGSVDVPCHPIGWGGHWGLGGVWTYHAIQGGVGIGDWGECGRTMPSHRVG